jgi:hypothetical protein
VPAENARDVDFDCILFQSRRNYDIHQYDCVPPAPPDEIPIANPSASRRLVNAC